LQKAYSHPSQAKLMVFPDFLLETLLRSVVAKSLRY
jgi:hypothetical protein